ncbi:MAG: preprotein translocase subunit YajC [Muribaculaceae bacterium]|nr:preprotein translocase subunit YajC [Muribaculaceae bacterium]MDE5975341.1 preprotein translocase subunit YajC [Muribaculaceae bacterium]MDE6298238.1 preprotein translocase subunit YajC [Muribaculaceae bacterium]
MTTTCSIFLLQTEAAGGGMSGMLMIIAMIVIFYFFMIRPQQKKQKEIKKAREAMQAGDKVVTAGGIHGKIKELTDTYVIMEVASGVCIKVDKASVFPAAQEQPKN